MSMTLQPTDDGRRFRTMPSPSEATPSTPSTNSIMQMSQVQPEDETATVMAPVATPPNDPPPAASVAAASVAAASAAAAKKRKQAADICKQADKEHASKLACLQFEQQMRKMGTSVSQLTTPLPKKNPKYDIERPIAPVGTVVNIGPDLSPRMCQHGGQAVVIALEGRGGLTTFTVEYHETASSRGIECGVPLSRIKSVINAPYFKEQRSGGNRKRTSPPAAVLEPTVKKLKFTPLKDDLVDEMMAASKEQLKRGWRATQRGLEKGTAEFRSAVAADYGMINAYLKGRQAETQTTKQGLITAQMKRAGNGCWKKATPTQNPLSFGRLAFAWDVAANYPKKAYQAVYQPDHYKVLMSNKVARKKRKREEEMGEEEVAGRKKASGLSVIEDRDYARSIFSPQYFYEKNYVARKTQEAQTAGIRSSRQEVGTFRKESQQKWKYLSDKDREPYNLLARTSDADQPSIKDRIIEAMKQNVTKTWRKVATDINDWCSEYTIRMWMESQVDFRSKEIMYLRHRTCPKSVCHGRSSKHINI
eukprot:scaffold187190_cov51-Attheya_sp.AAC.1